MSDSNNNNETSAQLLTSEKTLGEAQEMFRLLVEAVKDYAIFALDPEGNILTWNAGARRLKGYEAEEVIGSHFSQFYTDEDKNKNHPAFELEQAIKNGSYQEEGWRVAKNGTQFWASVVITSLKDSKGILRGFAKVTKDLTAHKANLDSLRESEERFRLLVSNVQDYSIITLDVDGNIKTWNLGAERIKGYSSSEIIGEHFSKFYTQEDKDSHKPENELVIATNTGKYEEESWRVRKDGSLFYANVIITAMRDETGDLKGFAKITRDLTLRKKAEDELHEAYDNLEERVKQRTVELAKAKEQAEQAVRARDVFLSIASHELKTPLTSLKLQIQMRKRNIKNGNFSQFDQSHIKNMVHDDEKQINRITRLVDDMLDINHLTSGKLSLQHDEANLGSLVQDVYRRFNAQLSSSNIEVQLDIAEDVTGIWDAYRIEQVFTNLLTNAIKYGAGKPINITVKKEADTAYLVVCDHGIGINKQDHARVFQQFERAISASSISGLGLGLYIAKQIIETHGGRINLASELGHGSEFTVELPYKALV